MNNEVIERVAKAIYENWANYPNCLVSKSWEEICEKLPAQANDFRRKAKAAVKATREPTDEMMFAACTAVGHSDSVEFQLKTYYAMIDEILK